jgi:hypothetical protein
VNAVSNRLPDAVWRSDALLRAIGRAGTVLLGAGRVNLVGAVPNGQRFRANPKRMWVIAHSRASVCGRDLGQVAPLREQVRLGDFWIPQSGRFFAGLSYLEPFDAARHASVTSRAPGGRECMTCA